VVETSPKITRGVVPRLCSLGATTELKPWTGSRARYHLKQILCLRVFCGLRPDSASGQKLRLKVVQLDYSLNGAPFRINCEVLPK
jgi:hypothetical protein